MTLGEAVNHLKRLRSLLSGEDLYKFNMKTVLLFKDILQTIDKLEVPELVGCTNEENNNENNTTIQS